MKWDQYFLEMAKAASLNSKCLSRQIGALLVRGKSVICTAYNGPPAGVPHCDKRHLHDNRLRIELEKSMGKGLPGSMTQCPRKIMGFNSGEGMQWCPEGL